MALYQPRLILERRANSPHSQQQCWRQDLNGLATIHMVTSPLDNGTSRILHDLAVHLLYTNYLIALSIF